MSNKNNIVNKSGLKGFSTTSEIVSDSDVFQGDKIEPIKMPERSNELREIHSAIEPAVRGDNPRNMFLYGKPGQGKTAAVKLKREQLLNFADDLGIDVNIVYIECNSINKSYHVVTKLIEKLECLDDPPRGFSLDDLYNRLFSYMNENSGTYIFILDEIDQIEDDSRDELSILYKLPRAYSSEDLNEDVSCSVIGISNDRRFKSNLSSRIKDSLYEKEVDFSPYTIEQLKSILYRRASYGLKNTELNDDNGFVLGVDSDVVNDDVIEACAKYAERERGSARQAIDLLGQAATIAHDERADTIEVSHVNDAQREVNKDYIKNMLDDHTTDDILALCGLMFESVIGNTPSRTSDIYDNYVNYTKYLGEEPLVQRRMRDRLQDLKLTGVIRMEKVIGGSPGGERWEYSLAIPLDETIEIMLNDESYLNEFGDILYEINSRR